MINGTQILFDNTTTSGTEYIGVSASGVLTSAQQWKIFKVTYDANNNPTSIKYAGGTQSEVNKWDDRATLVYS